MPPYPFLPLPQSLRHGPPLPAAIALCDGVAVQFPHDMLDIGEGSRGGAVGSLGLCNNSLTLV